MKDLVISTNIRVYELDQADESAKILIHEAKKATQTSYSPYSNYSVGAAVLLDGGEIIRGSNQENAAYPSGLCAERTAVFFANAQHPDKKVLAIAIIAQTEGDFVDTICSPCGSCRQVLAEVEDRYQTPIRILMCSKTTVYETSSIKDLLPLSFGSSSM